MSSSIYDQILARYLQAARIIATPLTNLATESSSKDDIDDSGEINDRAYGMQLLLQRQARILIHMHECFSEGKQHGLDEPLLRRRLADLANHSMSAFYAYKFDVLPAYWRRIYTDTLILTSHHAILRGGVRGKLSEDVLDEVVEGLDRAVVTAGGEGKRLGKNWIEGTLEVLDAFWGEKQNAGEEEPPCKKAKVANDGADYFPAQEPYGRPLLSPEHECPRHQGWTLDNFEDYMSDGDKGEPLPVVLTDLIKDWPALAECPWRSRSYLLSKTFGGRRLVPVETGRSYVDPDWGQEIISFRDFLQKYIDPSLGNGHDKGETPASWATSRAGLSAPAAVKVGYLAQHNLFQQIPSLRNDIRVPDFCWVDVPCHPTDASKDQAKVGVPKLNAWFGPAKTITPLHTDGYHNLLCQVVGTKYVRLYPPRATQRLRPRDMEHGVDMSNTSELDIGVLEGWDEAPEQDGDGVDYDAARKSLQGDAQYKYWECILQPGDTLLIPIGWWHYVRSLSVSFSVSFWWN